MPDLASSSMLLKFNKHKIANLYISLRSNNLQYNIILIISVKYRLKKNDLKRMFCAIEKYIVVQWGMQRIAT